jgi:hypothetical protein
MQVHIILNESEKQLETELLQQENSFSDRFAFVMANKTNRIPRVLSIQSHVVHGFVGNKCATFILQVFIIKPKI